MAYVTQTQAGTELNRPYVDDLPVHEWYRFVLSYPPHLVRDYVESFRIGTGKVVLDPYCGTGTTIVECKKLGIESVGIEPNPVVHMAASVKTDWSVDPVSLVADAERVAKETLGRLNRMRKLRGLNSEQERLLIKNSISPLPLHKAIVLRDTIRDTGSIFAQRYYELALAKHLVFSFSNLRFGPEVGVSRRKKEDVDVVAIWLGAVKQMAEDIRLVKTGALVHTEVHLGDAREAASILEEDSIDAVICSPPYPNEKDYTRTTRLESVVLGYLCDRTDLRSMKQGLMRSNTRNIYKGDNDKAWIAENERVTELADQIESRRIELGKTSGFEKMYHRVVRGYFGGMARHLEEVRESLRPGAKLAYVVGDQASFFRILIRTGEILAGIGEDLGYELDRIDLFRERVSTVTGDMLREEAVVFTWPG